ncbi:hypothetical protein L208DRAFT_1393495 [Tricholoma matsutake]|nr:hypothetical protein L208DRAFT_1393495 [Tricholoma matsutake 945]
MDTPNALIIVVRELLSANLPTEYLLKLCSKLEMLGLQQLFFPIQLLVYKRNLAI